MYFVRESVKTFYILTQVHLESSKYLKTILNQNCSYANDFYYKLSRPQQLLLHIKLFKIKPVSEALAYSREQRTLGWHS